MPICGNPGQHVTRLALHHSLTAWIEPRGPGPRRSIAADELVDGAKWMLARDLYCGVQLGPRSRVWLRAIDPPKAKSVGLYYTIDDNMVHFLSITQS